MRRNTWNDQQKKAEESREDFEIEGGRAKSAAAPMGDACIFWQRRLRSISFLRTRNSAGQSFRVLARHHRKANLGRIADAEYLGWVAYNNGDYKGATHWLELSKDDSPAALWLRAKLQRRAGKLTDAANTMARAVESLKATAAYTPREELNEGWTEYDNYPEGEHWGFFKSAHGDLGGLRLARGDFVQALDTLIKGKLWQDAA